MDDFPARAAIGTEHSVVTSWGEENEAAAHRHTINSCFGSESGISLCYNYEGSLLGIFTSV